MALTTDDLIYPDGELQNVMFPDGDIVSNVTAWLAEAVTKTTDENAQQSWIYYRAYTAVANRIAATPTSQSTNQGSHSVSWSNDRVKAFSDMANRHLTEYSRLSGDEVLSSTRPASLVVY